MLKLWNKVNQEIPDFYSFTVSYLDGSKETVRAVRHTIENSIVTVLTHENLWQWIPLSGIKTIVFDSNLTKIVEMQVKNGKV